MTTHWLRPFMAAALIVCVVLTSHAQDGVENGASIGGIPVREGNIEEMLKNVPEDMRRELVERLARQGYVIQTGELWALLQSPDAVLAAVSRTEEPVATAAIESMITAFRSAEDLSDQKMQLAALLYRYRVDEGRAYLFERLLPTHREPMVALIAALNTEEAHLEHVLATFDTVPFFRELCLALSHWKHERVVASLVGQLSDSTPNLVLLLSLARVGWDEAATPAERAFQEAPFTGLRAIEKAWTAAIIARLRPARRDAMIGALDELWATAAPFDDLRVDLIRLMRFIEHPDSDARLIQWTQEGLDALLKASPREASHAASWVTAGVVELSTRRSTETVRLAASALTQFHRFNLDKTEIAVALVRLGGDDADEIIGEHFPPRWGVHVNELMQLPALPPSLLPQRSRAFYPERM